MRLAGPGMVLHISCKPIWRQARAFGTLPLQPSSQDLMTEVPSEYLFMVIDISDGDLYLGISSLLERHVHWKNCTDQWKAPPQARPSSKLHHRTGSVREIKRTVVKAGNVSTLHVTTFLSSSRLTTCVVEARVLLPSRTSVMSAGPSQNIREKVSSLLLRTWSPLPSLPPLPLSGNRTSCFTAACEASWELLWSGSIGRRPLHRTCLVLSMQQ